jgi:hypothetical protein
LDGIIVVPGAVSIPQKGAPERIDPFGCIKINCGHPPYGNKLFCPRKLGVNNRAGIISALLVENKSDG